MTDCLLCRVQLAEAHDEMEAQRESSSQSSQCHIGIAEWGQGWVAKCFAYGTPPEPEIKPDPLAGFNLSEEQQEALRLLLSEGDSNPAKHGVRSSRMLCVMSST